MSETRVLSTPKDVTALAKRLSNSEEVTRFDSEGEQQAWILAHAFANLEESFRSFLDEQLPRLAKGNADEAYGLLLEIGEELRDILYHIEEPRFYEYLQETATTRTKL